MYKESALLRMCLDDLACNQEGPKGNIWCSVVQGIHKKRRPESIFSKEKKHQLALSRR